MITKDYRYVILDASAVITVIMQEPGWEQVTAILEKSVISSVNAAEVGAYMIKKFNISKEKIKELLEQMIAEIKEFTREQIYISADLVTKTQEFGLSLGDRACLSLAIETGYPVITADRVWSKLSIPNLEIHQIR